MRRKEGFEPKVLLVARENGGSITFIYNFLSLSLSLSLSSGYFKNAVFVLVKKVSKLELLKNLSHVMLPFRKWCDFCHNRVRYKRSNDNSFIDICFKVRSLREGDVHYSLLVSFTLASVLQEMACASGL